MKKALITGIGGQDGSYLAEFLLEKGYEVHGTLRRHSIPQTQTIRIEPLHASGSVKLHYADMTDSISIQNVISEVLPDEIYHLAAQSHVQVSFTIPQYTLNVNAGGTLSILESVRNTCPSCKIYFAATSEMFGNEIDEDGFQREDTPMVPVSPYGVSKFYAHRLCDIFRNSYGMFIASGILFNHESPRRATNFVTSKVIIEALKVKHGVQNTIEIGEMKAVRDWGHSRDYVRAMWLMLQREKPQDYVIATGVSRSVEYLCKYVAEKTGIPFECFTSNQKFMRPEEVWNLRGDASIAEAELGWRPEISFEFMINEMIEHFEENFEWYCYQFK